MRLRAERRGRRPPRPPCRHEDSSPESMPQYFQVSVNLLEAKKLLWWNPHSANSYVLVMLGKKKHRTSVRRNMVEPVYRESVVFELYMSLRELQRSSLWVAVMEPRFCAPPRLMGEAHISVGAIWEQPHHAVHHKWVQLCLTRDQALGPVGFLKVDISISFRGDVQILSAVKTVLHKDKLDENAWLPSGSEQQQANYVITVHGALGLPFGAQCHGHCGAPDRRHGKLPSTYIRVSFCGLTANTAVQYRNNNPRYSEQISIVEMFPNMNQTVRLEVCSADNVHNRVLGEAELVLSQISHHGENGFLPTFGPSLLPMYSNNSLTSNTKDEGPHYRGCLLVTMKTIVPYYLQGLGNVNVEPVAPVRPDDLWVQEEFCVFCTILEVSMLHPSIVSDQCGIAITIGDIPSEKKPAQDFHKMMTEIKDNKLHHSGPHEVTQGSCYGHLDFSNSFPVLQLATRLPDFRFRIHRSNMICGIISSLKQVITDVEKHLLQYNYTPLTEVVDNLNRAWDDAATSIMKFIEATNQAEDREKTHFRTELDMKQLALQKEELQNIHQRILKRIKANSVLNMMQANDTCTPTRKSVKHEVVETKTLVQSLKSLIYESPTGWPDIVVWLLESGSRVAFSRISPSDVIFSSIQEQSGRQCGRIQTICMKPLKCPAHMSTMTNNCFCIAGKIEIIMWMGLFKQKDNFESNFPYGYFLSSDDSDMTVAAEPLVLECRAFIYKAKLSRIAGQSNNINAFLRVNVFNEVRETEVQEETCSPVWNQVLCLQKTVHTTSDRVTRDPPVVIAEIYDSKSTLSKEYLIGRVQVRPLVDEKASQDKEPKLQWYDIHKGNECTGQVLMSIQVLLVPETYKSMFYYSGMSLKEQFNCAYAGDNQSVTVQTLPKTIVPQSTCYKVDVLWWGLRDVNITRKPCVVLEIDDLCIKSEILGDQKLNSNFPNGRVSQTLKFPLNDTYSPTLVLKLYDSSSFGRTLFLGTNVVKNPTKYIVNWLPKSEREKSLKSVSITSAYFNQVATNQVIIRRRLKPLYENDENSPSESSSSTTVNESRVKRSSWKKIFSRKEAEEEEYTLLPVYSKKKEPMVMMKMPSIAQCRSWWLKFSCSQMQEENDMDGEDILGREHIIIYNSELEKQPQFSKFKDWCSNIKLYNGNKTRIQEKDETFLCGILKVGIAMYKWPPPENVVPVSPCGAELDKGYFEDYPDNDPKKFLVRVYVVKALNLIAKDFTGKCDPYVSISCGKKHLGDRSGRIPNTINPVFGKMYEFRCTLPDDYRLNISLFDCEVSPPDELIGTTSIDLENRIYTRHRARVGLPFEYNLSGSSKWRDSLNPSEILEEICLKNHLPPPVFPDPSSVLVNSTVYRDSGQEKIYNSAMERKENLCLSLLHQWHTLLLCGYHLVPEHVETRTLYNPEKPGAPQSPQIRSGIFHQRAYSSLSNIGYPAKVISKGTLQLWVDVYSFDENTNIPPPVDINPKRVESYELRVIVWDAQLDLEKRSLKSKAKMDIYVKAWIGDDTPAQSTDVHYNVMHGEAHFSWRMIFHFFYHNASDTLVTKDVENLSDHSYPLFHIQVIESGSDEILGSLVLNLSNMPIGKKDFKRSILDSLKQEKRMNLFAFCSVRGWWPLQAGDGSEKRSYIGAIDLGMVLMPKDMAVIAPVGHGREAPSPIPEPDRNPVSPRRNAASRGQHIPSGRGRKFVWVTVSVLLLCLFAFLFTELGPFLYGDDLFSFSAFTRKRRGKNVPGIVRVLYPYEPHLN